MRFISHQLIFLVSKSDQCCSGFPVQSMSAFMHACLSYSLQATSHQVYLKKDVVIFSLKISFFFQ